MINPASSARLATPEVADRPCCNSVESAYWSGDFLKRFFLFAQSLISGMSAVLCGATVYDTDPTLTNTCLLADEYLTGNVSDTDHHISPDTCVRVELMVSQRRRQRANIKKTCFEKRINIHYLNLPPYPNRWMVWLIQSGLAWRPRCVKTCCQEDELTCMWSLLYIPILGYD